MRSKFSCVRSAHDLCARAYVHSLEGTFTIMYFSPGELRFLKERVIVSLGEGFLKERVDYQIFFTWGRFLLKKGCQIFSLSKLSGIFHLGKVY